MTEDGSEKLSDITIIHRTYTSVEIYYIIKVFKNCLTLKISLKLKLFFGPMKTKVKKKL